MKNVFTIVGIILVIITFNMTGDIFNLFGKGIHPAYIVGRILNVSLFGAGGIFLLWLGLHKKKNKKGGKDESNNTR